MILLAAWGAVMAAMVLSFGLLGVCLVGNLGRLPLVTLPSMPYASSLLLGMACLALATCAVVGCIYYFAFMRQFCKAYGRFHRNALSSSKGAPALPPLCWYPQFTPTRPERRMQHRQKHAQRHKQQHVERGIHRSLDHIHKRNKRNAREKAERFSDACHRQNAGQIQAESKRGKHVRKRRRFFMKTQPQKPDADAGRCKDEALQRAPRQIQEQFQHRMVPPVFNRKCRTGRAEGLLPEGQDVRSCRAQFPSRPGF